MLHENTLAPTLRNGFAAANAGRRDETPSRFISNVVLCTAIAERVAVVALVVLVAIGIFQ